eukprot:Em0015g174a
MFIFLRYGADDQVLFNPDCSIRLLLDNIKKRCCCQTKDVIALVDDKINIINLEESLENACFLFTDRGVYILVEVQKREDGVLVYKALLDSPDSDIQAKLEALSSPRGGTKTQSGKPKQGKKSVAKGSLTTTTSINASVGNTSKNRPNKTTKS